jgi:dihydrolipoamide dehydrogenase
MRIKASKIIMATGCCWELPSIPGAEGIITTDQILTMKEIPQSLVVLGGSDVGFTLATIFAKLGAEVTIAESTREILPMVDSELIAILERELKKNKITLYTETNLKSIKPGQYANFSTKNGEISVPAQYVLLAEGRKADVEELGIENIGVRLETGRIMVNEKMETGVSSVCAAGDVIGGPFLAHAAMAEGKVAVENALGKDSEIDYHRVPLCIGTIPEIACIGLTEAEAKAKGIKLKIGRFPFGANGLATVMGERTGLVKVISEAQYGQILGVHIIGPQASNLIPEAALAMRLEATPFEIASTIHAHPTFSEAVMEAALDVDSETIHALPAVKK